MNIGTFNAFGDPSREYPFAPILVARDQKATTVAGGSALVGFQTRDLNTLAVNTISGATLSGNALSLPSGTYIVIASAPAHQVNAHQLCLYNNTDSTFIIDGTCEMTGNAYDHTTRSFVTGVFTLNARKSISLQHYCTTAVGTDGLGVANGSAQVGVFSEIMLQKVA